MDGNRRSFLNKRSQPQFKRAGGPSKRREHDYVNEEFYNSFHSPPETVYRILCENKKIGSVIGKGGNIVKALREETQANITVSDSIPGSDDRVIIIFSPSDKLAKRRRGNNRERYDAMEPHCAAQDALLKVHDRIIEEDLLGSDIRNEGETVVTIRLLVSNNTVGCILGRKGDVIQRLRSETGSNIRVRPADRLPACATDIDELVQVKISGNVAIAKKALYEISTLLHQNPRKDAPPSHFSTACVDQGFQSPGPPLRNEFPPENSAWLEHAADAHRIEPMTFKGDYGIGPSAFDFDRYSPSHEREAPCEFAMKILCSADRIGGVIGKGGSNVRQLEHETGACIHVDNVSRDTFERVICVSSFEDLREHRSQTVDAILLLQDKTSEYSDKGTLITRLLVSSSKVGCILGQGGSIINEMRRRTHADIQVLSKKDKPKCALDDEELVVISGSYGVVKDALAEIASRLRARYHRDANTRGEPVPPRPLPGYGPAENLHGSGFHPSSGAVRGGPSGRYEHLRGSIHDFELSSFPAPPRATGYMDVDEATFISASAAGYGHTTEFGAMRMGIRDPFSSGSDFVTWEQFSSPRRTYPSGVILSPRADMREPPGASHKYNSQYRNTTPSPVPYWSPNINHVNNAYQSMRAPGSHQYR